MKRPITSNASNANPPLSFTHAVRLRSSALLTSTVFRRSHLIGADGSKGNFSSTRNSIVNVSVPLVAVIRAV